MRRRARAAAILVAAVVAACLAPGCKGEDRPAKRAHDTAAERAHDTAAPEVAGVAPHRRFATEADALRHILAGKPRILGVGEFHQTRSSAPARPAIERFTEAMEVVAASASDLVAETWVEDGSCGEIEEAVSQDVQEVIARPPAMESQVMRLLTRAREHGVVPHILTMRCDDYAAVADGGEVDYEKMLVLIRRKLAETALGVLRHRRQAGDERTIVLYGGALHNDIRPHEVLADVSYAADLMELVGDGYVELDLYVPEYIEGNPLLAQEPWYPSFAREAAPDQVLLYERQPRSYVLILRKGLLPGP